MTHLQPLDELFKILKDERVAELLKENEQLRQKSIDDMKLYRISDSSMHGLIYVLSKKNDVDNILKDWLEIECKKSSYIKFEYMKRDFGKPYNFSEYNIIYMLANETFYMSRNVRCEEIGYKIDKPIDYN